MKTFIAILIAILFLSCETVETGTVSSTKITDTIAPVISINGNVNDTAYLNTMYCDQGASVNETIMTGCNHLMADVTGTLNTNIPGTYFLYYNYTDASGNKAATATRTVHVIENDLAFLNGAYNVACSCTASINGNQSPLISISNYTAVVSPGRDNNYFQLNAINIGTENVPLFSPSIFNNSITLSYYSNNYDIRSTGSGTLSPTKNTFTIQTLAYLFAPLITYNCKNVFTKQLVIN